jgi:pyrimidine-nucleoside phosphorylase
MNMVHIIEKKRNGRALTTDEINWFVQTYTADALPDYQAAALLMAIYFQGMDRRETADLTLALAQSGDQLDLHDALPTGTIIVDKHSSGGVGDKTTLVVQPLVAACGIPVGKMSGRGLGASGGTLDKMESIRGWSCQLSLDQFKQQLANIGLVLSGQTADLAPADGKLYALRDVTGTVASTPLIAASIMSKKLAGGADAIVLDVKVGSGAFMPTVESAQDLARQMVAIGQEAGRQTVALISDMNQPLGQAIGNALEVKEAIATLQGSGPDDFWDHCLEVAAHMVRLAGKAADLDEAKEMITVVRDNGQGWAKFKAMVAAQGGDVAQVEQPDQLPQAERVEPIPAPRSGTIAAIDAGAIGWAAVHLGAGRQAKGESIDHSVGFILTAKVGQQLEAGQSLGQIHANDAAKLAQARQQLLEAITWADTAVEPLPRFYGTIT